MLYLDTSALAKLIVREAETEPLRAWIAEQRSDNVVTNAIGVVELQRLTLRLGSAAQAGAVRLLTRIDRLALTPAALSLAAQLPPPELRTLDALHIGSAAEIADLEALVTYDDRMAGAAMLLGLPVVSPGR